MRILHITTSKTGGAGLIAQTLAKSQQGYGNDVSFAVQSQQRRMTLLLSKLNTAFSFVSATHRYHQVTPYSVSRVDLSHVREFKPDLVYIHNWYNMLNMSDIEFITNNYRTIFFLHDERLLTGGCHVTLDCIGYTKDCQKCPASRVPGIASRAKVCMSRTTKNFGSYGIISPSEWLYQKVIKTEFGKNAKKIVRISNPTIVETLSAIPTRTHNLLNPRALFVTNDSNIPYKGEDLLLNALRSLDTSALGVNSLTVTIIGAKRARKESWSNGIHLYYEPSLPMKDMRAKYLEHDFLYVPSLSENQPGVINEAQLLGTVVIANNVGGIGEMIKDNFSGFLSESGSKNFAQAISRSIQSNQLAPISARARTDALIRTNMETIIEAHDKLYRDLTSE